ncbi:MAG: hypothetical protein MUD12_02005 [Spirochaetes bacterium]|jgi:hypothetical protein|nr:hypothetical protein [Spirochaetota bacterium]
MKYRIIPSAVLALILTVPDLAAQMPEWKFFRDREGNRYYLDLNGKIFITDDITHAYRAVSPEGIDYYKNSGLRLLKEHRKAEALSMLKSIMALPCDNERICAAQRESSAAINEMKKREGTRFPVYEKQASLLFFKTGRNHYLTDDVLMYSLRIPFRTVVIRRSLREMVDYMHTGLMCGIKKDDNTGGNYDMLIGIDAERFRGRISGLAELEKNWSNNLGYDGALRRELERTDSGVMYVFESRSEPYFSGLERICLNGNSGYCIRIVTSRSKNAGNEADMMEIIRGFSFIRSERKTGN